MSAPAADYWPLRRAVLEDLCELSRLRALPVPNAILFQDAGALGLWLELRVADDRPGDVDRWAEALRLDPAAPVEIAGHFTSYRTELSWSSERPLWRRLGRILVWSALHLDTEATP